MGMNSARWPPEWQENSSDTANTEVCKEALAESGSWVFNTAGGWDYS